MELFFSMALAAGPVLAHMGITFNAGSPDGTRDVQRIVPGASGAYRVTVTSTDVAAGTAFVHAYLQSREAALAQYLFTSAEPRCAVPQLEATQYGPKVFSAVGPLQPGETLACSYTVQRDAASIDDLEFSREYPCFECVTRRGTLPDAAFRVEEAVRSSDGCFRIGGAVAVARRAVTTQCAEFGGGSSIRGPSSSKPGSPVLVPWRITARPA